MRLHNKAHRRRIQGVTLIETILGFSILMMLGGAFTTLYMNAMAQGARIGSTTEVAWDAANAVDQVSLVLREARRFEFMDNGTSGPAAYQTSSATGNNSNYFATMADGTTIVTGLHIVYPARLSTISLRIPSGAVFTPTAMTGSNALVDYRTDGAYLDIYRSDAQGHPNPTNGSCLWIRGTLNGGPVATDPAADVSKGIDGRPLIDDVASWKGAIQFVQGDSNQVRLKIVTGKYDLRTREITSESTTGSVTALTADSVYLRNHDPSGVNTDSAHGKTQYSGN